MVQKNNFILCLTNAQVPTKISIMSRVYEELRKAIRASSKTRYRLWHDTGIDQGQLSRFMAGDGGLSIENVEKLVEALGLEIIVRPKRSEKRKV